MDKHFISNLLKGVASTSLGTFVTVVFHFLSIMLMTRYTPKDILGMYFLSLSIVHVLKIISGLGLDLTLVKFSSSEEGNPQLDAIASIIIARTTSISFVTIMFALTGGLILSVFDARLNTYIAYMIFLFALTSFKELLLHLMQGAQKFKEYALVQIISAALRLLCLMILRSRLNLLYLIYIEAIVLFLGLLVQLLIMRSVLLSLSRRDINSTSLGATIRFGVPLYCNNILTLVYDRSSVFLIGALLTPASVAAYEVALKIPESFTRLFSSFILVYFPNQSKFFSQGNRDSAQRFMNKSLGLLSTGIIFWVLIAFLYGEEIVLLLFSKEYVEVTLAFALLMLNFYLRAISNVLGYSLISAGYSSAPMKANVVAIIVNIVSSIVLIQAFGYIGAVYSLLLMNNTSQIIFCLQLKRVGITPDFVEYLKPALLLAATLVVYLLIGSSNLLFKLFLTILYPVSSWLSIREVRNFSHAAWNYIIRPRAHTFSA